MHMVVWGIEPRVVAWQSSTQPLRHASSTVSHHRDVQLNNENRITKDGVAITKFPNQVYFFSK